MSDRNRSGSGAPPSADAAGQTAGNATNGPKDSGKMTSKLVALSSAAVLAVYTAGYLRTKSAADRLADLDTPRRAAVPIAIGRLLELQPSPSASSFGAPQASADSSSSLAQATAPRSAPTSAAAPATAAVPSLTAPAAADTPVSSPPAAVSDEPAAGQTEHTAAEPAATLATDTATATPAAAAALESPVQAAPQGAKPQNQYNDGTYTGWGSCRHGDIQAEVVVAGGRIASARISQCWTRYSCNWLDAIVPQVAARQSPNVDYVSGATQSTDAFYYAVLEALQKAK